MKVRKLKILASHPVQYQSPFFRELVASGFELEVGFYHQGTALSPQLDTEFGIAIQWDVDLLSGYQHRFFQNGFASLSLKEQIILLPKLLKWSLIKGDEPLLLIGWFAHVVWFIWLIRILLNKPVIIYGDTSLAVYHATPKPRWRVKLLRWLIRHSDACLYIGLRNREFFESMGTKSSRLFHVPHSVDNTRFHEKFLLEFVKRQEWCADYGLNPELPTLLFCGKLLPKKRPLELLRGYHAADLQDKLQLIYVGEGHLRPVLEDYIQNNHLKNVHLLGFFNQTQLPVAHVLGEVLCLLSASEPWGLVVNEALACGRPVIVSEAVGCSADLITSHTGWVVPVDNQQALVKTLQAVYGQRENWAEMGEHGRQTIAQYTFRAMADGVEAAVDTVSSKNRKV